MALSLHKWDAASQGPLSTSSMLQHLREQGFSGSVYTFPTGAAPAGRAATARRGS